MNGIVYGKVRSSVKAFRLLLKVSTSLNCTPREFSSSIFHQFIPKQPEKLAFWSYNFEYIY